MSDFMKFVVNTSLKRGYCMYRKVGDSHSCRDI